MSTRIPPLLEPYLAVPPEASLILLTSILGASTNWLVVRYLHNLLSSSPPPSRSPSNVTLSAGETTVVLLSFLRDYAFWRDGAGRLGTDLDAAGRKGRFVFVDGLSGLFLPGGGAKRSSPEGWTVTLGSGKVADVRRSLNAIVDEVVRAGRDSGKGDAKVVLVVDQLDLFLAAGEGNGQEGVAVREMMLELREKTHATIMTLAADEPLVAGQATTLEKEHSALVLAAAHEAEMVLSLRLLDTGTAKDVSGVVRITRGGAESSRNVEEKEYLYYVGGDGGVRVFERGH